MVYLRAYAHRGVYWGILGGLVGAAVFCAIAYVMPVNGHPFFVELFIGQGLGAATASGWAVNLVGGMAIGAIFGYLVSYYDKVNVSSYWRGLIMGALAAALVWSWLFVPVFVGSMPYLATNYAQDLSASFGDCIVFGFLMGVITSYGTIRILEKHPEIHRERSSEIEANPAAVPPPTTA